MVDPNTPLLDVHDGVCRALQTLATARAQVVAITRQAVIGPCEPADVAEALAAVQASLGQLRDQLHIVDVIADGIGIDVVLEIRPATCPREPPADASS